MILLGKVLLLTHYTSECNGCPWTTPKNNDQCITSCGEKCTKPNLLCRCNVIIFCSRGEHKVLLLSRASSWGVPKIPWAQRDPEVTLMTCDAVGERAQVILVWVKAPGVGNASHPQRLRNTKVRPSFMSRKWCVNATMFKNTLIKGMS